MRLEATTHGASTRPRLHRLLLLPLVVAVAPAAVSAQAGGARTIPVVRWDYDHADPRIGLAPGLHDAGEAIRNLEKVATGFKPEGFFDPSNPGAGGYNNTDLAFHGDFMFLGNYNGWQAYDISDPAVPKLRIAVVCPGGQGDVSVHHNLLFMSAQETRGRLDCGTGGVADTVSTERFRGVRIFDISDIDNPRQVAAVQTCRGSHTHSLVTSPRDPDNVYVFVSGTSAPRPAAELPGCSRLDPDEDPNTSYWRIEVIRVPLAAPAQARIVSAPRIFSDRETGEIAGLWGGGDHGPGTQTTSRTNQCHDITAYADIGLAGGACAGNGILLDIRDPASPKRIEAVLDPNFAYWHSATFNNDGNVVVFTDEWGGGSAPRCRDTDPPTWGADAIFRRTGDKLQLAGYYKLPVPQTAVENCVAHNGSLIPVPGRDIMAQAWYQGGVSVFDFTDPAHPVEIAFFDRGRVMADRLLAGGYWSAYWYNGYLYGAEISRGFDVFRLTPSEHLTQNEIDAAALARSTEFNAQHQARVEWPASFVVAKAYTDQLERYGALSGQPLSSMRATLDRGEHASSAADKQAAAAALEQAAGGLEASALQALAGAREGVASRTQARLASLLRELAGSLR